MKPIAHPQSAIPNQNTARPGPVRWNPSWRRTAWLGVVLALPAVSLQAAESSTVPAAINYQGKLTDTGGKPVTNGLYQVEFRIWDHATATNSADYLWGRSFALYVSTNGTFNVLLSDDGGTLSPAGTVSSLLQAFEGPVRYLGLTVKQTPSSPVTGAVEISPRQQLVTAPYAVHAYQASLAERSNYATNAAAAANATYALTATNALKFNNFTTNDFLLASKSAQTLTGSLTVTNGTLTARSNVTVSGATTLSSNLTVSGKVGIGITTTPNLPLTFADVAGDKVSFYGNSTGAHTGIGISSTALQIYTREATQDIALGYGASATFTNTMVVKNTGKVGIGTANPGAALQVGDAGVAGSQGMIRLGSKSPTSNNYRTWDIGVPQTGTNVAGKGYSFVVDDTANGTDPEFLIRYDTGNVGIGTTNPVARLDVNGTIKVKSQAPIVLKRYSITDIPTAQRDTIPVDTTYPVSDWSAVIAGFHFNADINETQNDRFLEVRMRPRGTVWAIYFDVAHQDVAVTRIEVDVMFIRKELVDDSRN